MDESAPDLLGFDKKISARINAVIAILKDIEKTQTKPTLAMIQMLFQEQPAAKKEILQARPVNETPLPKNERTKNTEQELQTKQQLREVTKDVSRIFENVTVTRSSFGRPYLRLNLSPEEFEKLKIKFHS